MKQRKIVVFIDPAMANASLQLLDAICTGRLPVPDGFSPELDCPLSSAIDGMYPLETRLLMTLIFSTLSIVGVVGNLLVITVVLRVKGMKTPTNCYLVSLALSDMLFFIATAPTELAYLHVFNEYIFGIAGCAIFTYLPYLAINSSSLSITAFTIERFIGICYPYRARTICTVKRARFISLCIWAFSIIYNSPWLYLASLGQDSRGSYCDFKMDRSNWTYKVMFLGDFFAFYTIPMLLNIIIYGRIAVTLTKCVEFDSEKGKNSELPPMEGASHVSGRRKSAGKNQVVKMLALVVIVFATCWLPYRAMVMYNSFAEDKWNPDWYIFFSKTLIFINCAINPILYNLMSIRFREAFRSLLKGEPVQGRYTPVLETQRNSRQQRSTRKKQPEATDNTILI